MEGRREYFCYFCHRWVSLNGDESPLVVYLNKAHYYACPKCQAIVQGKGKPTT